MSTLPNLVPTIQYLIPVTDGDPYQATPLQGFAPSLLRNAGLIQLAAHLPSNVLDLSPKGHDTFLAVRLGGHDPVRWYPKSPKAIRSLITPPFYAFTVLLLGEEDAIDDYRAWLDEHAFTLTTVAANGGVIDYDSVGMEALQAHFLQIIDEIEGQVDEESRILSKKVVSAWQPLPSRKLGYQVKGHNSVHPNLMALSAAGFDDLVSGRFDQLDDGINPYVDQIIRTAESVLEERERIGQREAHRQFRPPPDVNLFAPAVYPHVFEISWPKEVGTVEERQTLQTVQRLLRNQSGYFLGLEKPKHVQAALGVSGVAEGDDDPDPAPHPLFMVRAEELRLGTYCAGAMAASEISAFLRMPNEVNRTAGQVRQFASQYRNPKGRGRKRTAAFKQVQSRINASVPERLKPLVARSQTGVRIIANAHLEWLDVDGLPLCLAKNTSRIPVTPGNLFVQQIAHTEPLHLTPEAFEEVLIIKAVKTDDPIRPAFESALEVFSEEWQDRISVREIEVDHEDVLVEALNTFTGALMIFDGHGSHHVNQPAHLHLMDRPVDVWTLESRIHRPPPIALLSACDTHAADRNHATAGNGFLALGSRSVISSVFPLNALDAAGFAARLLYRISHYIPAAFNMFRRSLTWLEFVSGLLRMQALTDFQRLLQARKMMSEAQYKELGSWGNVQINGGTDEPFERILDRFANELGVERASLVTLFTQAIAHSSAISYCHLGRPETIIIHPHQQVLS